MGERDLIVRRELLRIPGGNDDHRASLGIVVAGDLLAEELGLHLDDVGSRFDQSEEREYSLRIRLFVRRMILDRFEQPFLELFTGLHLDIQRLDELELANLRHVGRDAIVFCGERGECTASAGE